MSKGLSNGSRTNTIKTADDDHEWKPYSIGAQKIQVCKRCGVVRRADDKNNKCRGKVRVVSREK